MKKEWWNITNYIGKIMVKIDIHKAILVNILRGIYSDPLLRSTLGFKGGTAALLFYQLPRFSVDLDFDLLDPKKKPDVLARLKELLPQFGTVREAKEKYFTLFFLLSYKTGERNLKIEISKRSQNGHFVPKNHLGISMLVMKEEDMAAGKLAAVLTRKKFAARDLYDLWFFLSNRWPINETMVSEKTGLSLSDAFKKAESRVGSIKKTELLAGLGDLLNEKQKNWAREKLKDELLFQIKLYRESIK